jgi:hypothetical protein
MTNCPSYFSKNRNFLISWFIALCAAFTLAACGGGGGSTDGSTTTTTPATVVGVVQDAAGQPAANVQVQIADQTTTTAADGRFSFTVNSSSESIVMLVKKSGFASNAKDVPINPGSTTDITVKIFADQVSTTFNASAGSTLSLANGASAVIPANGLQTSSGVAYTGTVNVGASYFGPDTLDGVLAFPAPYVGTDAGVQSPLITAGVIEVKLTDAAGNPLQLKSGSPATLTYPASSVSAGAASIPMWYYDEANKMWMRDGQATLQANGTYQGNVTHFTVWNLDFKGDSATINACFKDTLGMPVSATGYMRLRSTGWEATYFNTAINSDGLLSILRVPANIPLELISNTQPAAFTSVVIPALKADEVRQLACVVVGNPGVGSNLVLTPPSTIFTTSAGSFAGSYSGTYSGNEAGNFAITVTSLGQVTGTVTSTTYPGVVVSVLGAVGAGGAVSMSATGQAGIASFQGTATGAGSVSGSWRYTSGLTGNGVFSGQRN